MIKLSKLSSRAKEKEVISMVDNVEREDVVEKEPFDYGKFVKFYLHDRGDCKMLTGDESEDVKSQYERMYYRADEVKTIAEFGDYLDKMDASC